MATDQVVIVVRGAEIGVAREVVGQEPDADRHGDEPAGERQIGQLRLVEELGLGEIALDQRLEVLFLGVDLGKILLVLGRRRGRSAHHVAKVVQGRTGHGGVEVDHHVGPVGRQHDVVDLGVVVGDALGDFTRLHQLHDLGGLFAARIHPGELLGDQRLAALDVLGRRLVEETQPIHRVVELGDDLPEPRRGQVGEIVLELGERPRHQLRLRRIGDEIDRGIALQERIEPPGILVAFDLQRTDALLREVPGHAQHVLFQHVRREDVGVDALQDVARARFRFHLEGVVDVAGAVALDRSLVGDAHGGEGLGQLLLGIVAVAHLTSCPSWPASWRPPS